MDVATGTTPQVPCSESVTHRSTVVFVPSSPMEGSRMLDVVLLAAGAVGIVVATFFRDLQRWSITPPMLGLLVGIVLGPQVMDALTIPGGDEVHVLKVAARLLLAVALMAIGLRYPIDRMRERMGQVAVMILIVLPAMAAVLAAGATLALGLPLGVALVLGTALSPTDPVLASGIVTGEVAEQDIPARERQLLSLESGSNDGLALPFVILAIAWALDRPMLTEAGRALYEVAAAVLIGIVLGVVAGRALRWAEAHREIGQSVRAIYTLVLAALALGASGLLQAGGLLSVFVAGLAHNHTSTDTDRAIEVGLDESLNQFLVLPIFILLGAALPWSAWSDLGWGGVLFVLIALFVRRLPIVLAVRRPLRADGMFASWLGWFGPIGVAALYYLGHADEHGVTDPRVWAAGTLVIAVSTVIHGLTAGPARVAYRRRTGA